MVKGFGNESDWSVKAVRAARCTLHHLTDLTVWSFDGFISEDRTRMRETTVIHRPSSIAHRGSCPFGDNGARARLVEAISRQNADSSVDVV